MSDRVACSVFSPRSDITGDNRSQTVLISHRVALYMHDDTDRSNPTLIHSRFTQLIDAAVEKNFSTVRFVGHQSMYLGQGKSDIIIDDDGSLEAGQIMNGWKDSTDSSTQMFQFDGNAVAYKEALLVCLAFWRERGFRTWL